MTQKGTHTWDMVVSYHKCPECGYIVENQDVWKVEKDHYEKPIVCPRCKHSFVAIKPRKKGFGPFFGEPTKPDFDWS